VRNPETEVADPVYPDCCRKGTAEPDWLERSEGNGVMEKIKKTEVLEGEIVDDQEDRSKVPIANEINVEKKENKMEKAEKWIDAMAVIGSGLLKFFSILSKGNPFTAHENSEKRDSSSGRRRRRQGKRQ
jgi:hypothetical protein